MGALGFGEKAIQARALFEVKAGSADVPSALTAKREYVFLGVLARRADETSALPAMRTAFGEGMQP